MIRVVSSEGKNRRIKTTMDDYVYTSDDEIVEGEVEEGKIYEEADFNKIIEIKEREDKRVRVFMSEIDQNEKTIVFCATQDHALAVRDLINQRKISKEPNYCVRVTANDGELGEQYLREFKDNEKTRLSEKLVTDVCTGFYKEGEYKITPLNNLYSEGEFIHLDVEDPNSKLEIFHSSILLAL